MQVIRYTLTTTDLKLIREALAKMKEPEAALLLKKLEHAHRMSLSYIQV